MDGLLSLMLCRFIYVNLSVSRFIGSVWFTQTQSPQALSVPAMMLLHAAAAPLHVRSAMRPQLSTVRRLKLRLHETIRDGRIRCTGRAGNYEKSSNTFTLCFLILCTKHKNGNCPPASPSPFFSMRKLTSRWINHFLLL